MSTHPRIPTTLSLLNDVLMSHYQNKPYLVFTILAIQ